MSTLNVVLCHHEAEFVERVIDLWREITAEEHLLILHGGRRSDFDAIEFANKVFVDDPQLRTVDHQRERQSYAGIWRKTADWLANLPEITFVHVSEFDHIPLRRDLNFLQTQMMRDEAADVLAFHLQRIDGTAHPHYLSHSHGGDLEAFLRSISVREDAGIVLSMMGTGSVWRREAFLAVANCPPPAPLYMELFLPSVAHHLGFRVRSFSAQDRWVSPRGDRVQELSAAQNDGAWTLHPVKTLAAGFHAR